MPKGGVPARNDVRWRDVKRSSNVRSVGWDNEGNMYVMFIPNGTHNGSVYRYEGVSRQRAVAASCARSAGQYINRVIKPNFPAVRIV